MMRLKTSHAEQDYLKALYFAEEATETRDPSPVPTGVLADRLRVSPASATNMLKKLAGLGMVDHVSYRGARLTPAGRKVALEVIRHHRLLETYLAEALGVPWEQVHDEAEILEHFLSEDLEDRIASVLGHPTADPHGHAIPAKDGSIPFVRKRRLWDVEDGCRVQIGNVPDDEPEALRYLARSGMRPGTTVEVVGRGPLAGPLFVHVEGEEAEVSLSRDLAEAIWVT